MYEPRPYVTARCRWVNVCDRRILLLFREIHGRKAGTPEAAGTLYTRDVCTSEKRLFLRSRRGANVGMWTDERFTCDMFIAVSRRRQRFFVFAAYRLKFRGNSLLPIHADNVFYPPSPHTTDSPPNAAAAHLLEGFWRLSRSRYEVNN